MKIGKLLSLGVMLALALTIIAPVPVGAAPRLASFEAHATIDEITTGTVSPLYGDWWLVSNREVIGTMSGDICGDYALVYQGVFQLLSQAGVLRGNLDVGTYQMQVRAATQPLEMVFVPEYGVELPRLTISGAFTFQDGTSGAGTINASAVLLLDTGGHVLGIVSSEVTLQGKWRAKR